jgi:predicted Holliday junction resolvase-like endonuclease
MMIEEPYLEKSDKLVVDFTAFAMAVVTMSLLLIVEVIRHKIDHLAQGKEIFEHVLEAVYRECKSSDLRNCSVTHFICDLYLKFLQYLHPTSLLLFTTFTVSTLGIVEAIVFLVQHYYKDMNKTVKQVFYEVHFTLFYVAIINAIMSCLLYFFASRVAEKQWVRLEKVDLDHYVAIRKQFDAFKEQLQAIKKSKDASKKSGSNLRQDSLSNNTNVMFQLLTESRIPFLKANLKKMLNNKYRKLLVQVRFHELRVHFIESNGLDPRFCVSTYLKLCMNDVFKSLVHISTFSWLILLGCTNLVYFAMGIITAETNDKRTVGTSLSFIYVGYSIFFVVFSIIIGRKVKKIFFTIMKHEEWVKRNESVRNLDDKSQEKDDFHQLDYFWGSDPTIIIVVCQFMQFGFALALGILLVFNENVYDQQSPLNWVGWYFVAPIFCYVMFVVS